MRDIIVEVLENDPEKLPSDVAISANELVLKKLKKNAVLDVKHLRSLSGLLVTQPLKRSPVIASVMLYITG